MITLQPPRGGSTPSEDWAAWSLSKAGLTRFTRRAVDVVGLPAEPDVLLTGDVEIRRLNREFRGKNKATDVLSFPAPAELAGMHGGDLAISLETAARQAAEQGHSLNVELRVLLLHGLLHLNGMDHETDAGQMALREAELRRALRLPPGLIARVAGEPKRELKKRVATGQSVKAAARHAPASASLKTKQAAGSRKRVRS